MIKTNCELPLEMLLDGSNERLNDYDFVLFHLYQSNDKYREYYKTLRERQPGRLMILDNSAYEFYVKGEKLDMLAFVRAINDLKPDIYILPDTLMDKNRTIEDTKHFLTLFGEGNLFENERVNHGIPMAILQGNTEEDLLDCAKIYKNLGIECIGIPFHNSFFKDLARADFVYNMLHMSGVVSEYDYNDSWWLREDMHYAMGRVRFIQKNLKTLRKFKHVHVLGSHCPFEKVFYKDLDTMDTGYPTKLGILNEVLGNEYSKPSIIIDDFLEDKLTELQRGCIIYNVSKFHEYSGVLL